MGIRAQWVNLDRWQADFDRLADDPIRALDATTVWTQATEAFFAESQRVVHVITGDLMSSGFYEVMQFNADELVGYVEYGIEYAPYEFGRGGDHDALTVAWDQTERIFESAFEAMFRNFGR